MTYIKDWFFSKVKAENPGVHFFSGKGEIVRETEKAVLLAVEFVTLDGEREGVKNVWVPKSCTMTEAEHNKAADESNKRFEAACDAYNKLIELAKANGVKGVRSGMKKVTIMKKLAEAGVQI